MYCPNCGKLNPQEDKFCMYCGAQLIDNQNTPVRPAARTVSFGNAGRMLRAACAASAAGPDITWQ